ncbi:tail knob protein [Microbacterium phage Curie]
MDTSYGKEFAYNLWTPNTQLTFTNVPFTNAAADIVRPESREAFDNYLNNRPGVRTVNNMQPVRVNEPIVVDLLFTEVQEHNYVRATNYVQPGVTGSKQISYYYFILGARHTATHTTELIVQLDVWHTFFDKVNIGNAYLEQGHKPVAAENAFQNYGRDFLTVPEGLDYGTDYRVMRTAGEALISTNGAYSLMIGSTIDLLGDLGTTEKTSKVPSAKASKVQGLVSGAAFYVFDSADHFVSWMETMSNKPWATQGIVSITAIPQLSTWVEGWDSVPLIPALSGAAGGGKLAPAANIKHRTRTAIPGWRAILKSLLPERYRLFDKFLTSPYCMVEITSQMGQAVMLRPEAWRDPDAKYRTAISILPPGQRAAWYPVGYNRNSDTDSQDEYTQSFRGDDQGDYLDVATTVAGFPAFAMVNNAALTVLASSQGGLSFAAQANDWAQQRNLESNRVGYEQASAGIDLATSMMELQNSGIRESRGISDAHAISSAISDTVAGVPNLALGQTLTAGANAMIASSEANNQAALEQRQNVQASRLTGQNAEYLRDTNRKLADWGAKGDHAQGIAAIDAKVRDISMIPPSVIGQVGGDMFNMVAARNGVGMVMKFKMIDEGAIRRIGEHWIRYGYQVHQRIGAVPNLHCMSHFTYWKMRELYLIDTPIPEGMKNIIIGMFEKGVTVWRNPDDIGRIDMGINTPSAGVML